MFRAIHTAATGMEAMQMDLDNIANNLANVNTTGYKRGTAKFQDLFYQTLLEPGVQTGRNTISPTGVQVGAGVKTASLYKEFTQGSARMTNAPLDLMIEGDGFFSVEDSSGEIRYTRDGNFRIGPDGKMMTSSGNLLQPGITIPPNVLSVGIERNGTVTAQNSAGDRLNLGQIQLVRFINPSGLKAVGGNLYKFSEASGVPEQGIPGTSKFGRILSGALEGSNVNIVTEMVNMIKVQRSYEMNSKVMQAADAMLSITNNVVK